jgi:exodeoxyribonuclease VII small subunit
MTDPRPEAETFEASTERLARIVEELERGDLPLEQSLALFEEGVGLARRAQAHLDRAERRVEELLGFDPQNRPVTREVPPVSGKQGAT